MAQLEAWLERLKREAIRDADLEGIVLTGLGSDGFGLLQRCASRGRSDPSDTQDVDKSGDVQTAALAASFVHPGRLNDARAERWVASYRKLLDAWQLYIHRARFDVARGARTRADQQALRDAGVEVEAIDMAPSRVLLRCNCASDRGRDS